MAITGTEFKALEIQEQVQFVNDCLTNGYSVDQIRIKIIKKKIPFFFSKTFFYFFK